MKRGYIQKEVHLPHGGEEVKGRFLEKPRSKNDNFEGRVRLGQMPKTHRGKQYR